MAAVSLETAGECTLGDTDNMMEEIDLSGIDEALLTALLEEPQVEQPVDEHLAEILRSFEAEIGYGMMGTGVTSTSDDGEPMAGDPEDILLDDMASEAHRCSACTLDEDPFGWVDVDDVPPYSCDEMSDLYLGSDEMGLMGYEEPQGYAPVEGEYGPLWQ